MTTNRSSKQDEQSAPLRDWLAPPAPGRSDHTASSLNTLSPTTARRLSLSTHGTRVQFSVGLALVSILPALIVVYVGIVAPVTGQGTLVQTLVSVTGLILAGLGYVILLRYPQNIVRLRKYLEQIARDDLPESIDFAADEDDVQAINYCVRTIVDRSSERIARIEKQSKELVRTERERVMMESFATVCHHLSQPFTALLTYLHLLKDDDREPEFCKKISSCEKAAAEISDFLKRIQMIDNYETEPYYRAPSSAGTSRRDRHIIKVPAYANADACLRAESDSGGAQAWFQHSPAAGGTTS